MASRSGSTASSFRRFAGPSQRGISFVTLAIRVPAVTRGTYGPVLLAITHETWRQRGGSAAVRRKASSLTGREVQPHRLLLTMQEHACVGIQCVSRTKGGAAPGMVRLLTAAPAVVSAAPLTTRTRICRLPLARRSWGSERVWAMRPAPLGASRPFPLRSMESSAARCYGLPAR